MKKITTISVSILISSLVIWQLIFYKNSSLTPIIWEIHTIFLSVLLFFSLIHLLLNDTVLDIIKIIFRILFKVWFVIFIAFSMKKTFDMKGFLLTATFIFGYLEGLIDLNVWFNSGNGFLILKKYDIQNTKKNRTVLCVAAISFIHIISAIVAFLFFDVF